MGVIIRLLAGEVCCGEDLVCGIVENFRTCDGEWGGWEEAKTFVGKLDFSSVDDGERRSAGGIVGGLLCDGAGTLRGPNAFDGGGDPLCLRNRRF